MRATRDDGTPVAVKRFHRHNRDGEDYDADGEAALREFECLCELAGAEGHAPMPFALGTCTDKQGLTHHAIAMEYVEGFTVEQALASGVLSETPAPSTRPTPSSARRFTSSTPSTHTIAAWCTATSAPPTSF